MTVRHYVEGRPLDRDGPDEVGAAAGLLARLHAVGHCPEEDDLNPDRAHVFLAAYRHAAGGFERGTGEVLVPLMRHELRLNARDSYWQAAREDDRRERDHAGCLAGAFTRVRNLDPALLLRRSSHSRVDRAYAKGSSTVARHGRA